MCTFVLYFRFFEKKKFMSCCFFYVCLEHPSSVHLDNFEVDEEYDDDQDSDTVTFQEVNLT